MGEFYISAYNEVIYDNIRKCSFGIHISLSFVAIGEILSDIHRFKG